MSRSSSIPIRQDSPPGASPAIPVGGFAPTPYSPRTLVPTAPRFVSLDVLRGIAILLMLFSGLIPKTLPNWMDHGYQPHYKPDATGAWVSALNAGDAVFDGRWKAMTWVDLVFPMFLFSMGAAIPIAMSRRLDRGESKFSLLRTLVARFLMLLFFALLISNLNPPSIDGQSDDAKKLFVLAAGGVAFLFFMRWPSTVPTRTQRTIRILSGLVLVGLVLANAVQRADMVSKGRGEGLLFAWGNDTILAVLAYAYLISGVAWLILPRWPWLRLLLLVPLMLVAHYIAIDAKTYPDWLWMGDWPTTRELFKTNGGPWTLRDVVQSPLLVLNFPKWIEPLRHACESRPWLRAATSLTGLYNFTWLKYLWIAVPGTIVGDWLVRRSSDEPRAQWIDPLTGEIESEAHPFPRWLILGLSIAAVVLTCVGFRSYFLPTLGVGGAMKTPYFALTFAVPVIVLTAILALVRVPREEWLVRRLCVVGAIVATLGLVLACLRWPLPFAFAAGWRVPTDGIFEGGVSKGPPATLSYYLTSTGLCMLLLAGLYAVIDSRHRMRRGVGVIEANGQNPLLVYYAEHLIVNALFSLAIFVPFHAATSGDSWWSHVRTLDDLGASTSPWLGAAWGAGKTILIALAVWTLTRRKIFWRA